MKEKIEELEKQIHELKNKMYLLVYEHFAFSRDEFNSIKDEFYVEDNHFHEDNVFIETNRKGWFFYMLKKDFFYKTYEKKYIDLKYGETTYLVLEIYDVDKIEHHDNKVNLHFYKK